MRRSHWCGAATAAAICACGVQAAQAQVANEEAARRFLRREFVLPVTFDPTASRATTATDSGATVVAAAGSGRGEFKLAMRTPDQQNLFSVALSAPLVDGATRFVLGDQLPAGNKLVLEGTRLLWSRTTVDSTRAQSLLSRTATTAATSAENVQRLASLSAELEETRATDHVAVFVISKYEYSRETFKFRPEGAAEDEPELHEPWSYSVSGGVSIRRAGWSFPIWIGAGYRESTTWKGAAARTFCTPVTGSTALECENHATQPPTSTVKESLSVEFRQRGKDAGWMPFLACDLKAARGKRWSFELPLYLAKSPSDNTALTGGVVLGARQGSGRFFAIFVGSAFSFPQPDPPDVQSVHEGLKTLAR